jgi:hypothetical protein
MACSTITVELLATTLPLMILSVTSRVELLTGVVPPVMSATKVSPEPVAPIGTVAVVPVAPAAVFMAFSP